MIAMNGLTQRYGTFTALDSLTLSITAGETVGLLGPNGAGKTTTLRMLAGLDRPAAGRVTVDGIDPWSESDRVRRLLGVVPDGAGLYERLTVTQNLSAFASLYDLPIGAVATALAQTGVADLAGRIAGKLSKGQRQRVALARALLHTPAILVLDEPTAGLDPTATAAFHALITQQKALGTTVVLCSHNMAEVDELCDRVALLDRGRLAACDTPARLKEAYGRHTVQAKVQTADGIRSFEWGTDDPDGDRRLDECRSLGRLISFQTSEASLAEVFIHLTGRELA
jgi:ABC-2 type transport system ATP-binding protein